MPFQLDPRPHTIPTHQDCKIAEMLKVGLETVDSNLSIHTQQSPQVTHWRTPHRPDLVSDSTTELHISRRENNSTRRRAGSTAGWDSRCEPVLAAASAPRPSRPGRARAQARGSRRGSPEVCTGPPTEILTPNRTASETRRTTRSRRPKRRGQGRGGRGSSRPRERPPGPASRRRLLTSGARERGQHVQQRPAEVKGSTTAAAGRRGPERGTGHGERRGTGRGAESSGTAAARDLPRFTARGKGKAGGARAPTRQRAVTSPRRSGPHVGLFGSRQAPPLPRRLSAPPPPTPVTRAARGRVSLVSLSGLPPSSVSAESRHFGARPQPRPRVGTWGDRLPPGLSPGPAAIGPQSRATSSGRWSRCLQSLHVAAASLSVEGFARAHHKACSAGLAGPPRPNQPT